ncbi:HEAT repeat-containing protein isoform 2 [Schistosoma japonicum]|uniref:HEAT repeat-containing protein isoform 2 n=1 Tax=Schistosoma japonicum TaxID=6182 RepID=A0A4Z2CXV3_SCHJA|nr:HEAT repeat-containing protein isoform 2 [Schistosoma japonicum]
MSISLLFDETAYEKLPEVKKPIFVFDWLCLLEKQLVEENKQAIKECQEDLVQQLLSHLTHAPGRQTHKLLGRCFANLFLVGDSFLLYTAVNTCNALLKSRDDGPASINSRLAALSCLGAIYKRLGRMIGRSFEDSVIIMVKLIKQSESQVRCETMNTFRDLVEGVGSASSVCHKDIYKAVKTCMTDRVLYVRVAAVKCLYFLVDHSHLIHVSELEATVSLCLRCMDGSNYITRLEAARTLGHLLAKTQRKKSSDTGSDASNGGLVGASSNSRSKPVSLTDALSLLSSGFLKGPGGFLKGTSATDMIKGTTPVNREVRVGVTYAYIEFIVEMGPLWFESNLSTILTHLVNLLLIPRATPTHVEAIYARQCIHYLLGTVFRHLLSESIQLVAISELIKILVFHLQYLQNLHVNEYSMNSGDVFQQIFSSSSSSTLTVNNNNINESADSLPNDIFNETRLRNNDINIMNDNNHQTTQNLDSPMESDSGKSKRGFGRQGGTAVAMATTTTSTTGGIGSSRSNREQQHQHLVICVLDIISQLIRWLDSLVVQLLDQPTHLADVLCSCLAHPIQAVRLAAASCLRQLVIVLPSQRIPLLNKCLHCLQQSHKYNSDTLVGVTFSVTGLMAGVNHSIIGLPNNLPKQLFSLAEDLLRAANQNSRFTLARTQSGWNLLSACITLGPNVVKPHLPRILLFWRNAFPRSLRELEAEKQRGDAFTWQIMLESRSGALCSIQSFLEYCSPQLLTEDIIHRLLPLIECGLNMLGQMNDIVRIYGNHLKIIAGFIRLRLYRILLLLPSTVYTSSYSTILRELVAEFTLTDNMVNTTTSLFKSLCHSEDSVTLGSCLQDTDQRILEEQLQSTPLNNSPTALEHDPSYLYLQEGVTNLLTTDVTLTNLSNVEDDDSEQLSLTAGTLFHGSSDVLLSNGISATSKFYGLSSASNANTNNILHYLRHNPGYFTNSSLSCGLQLTGPMPVSVAVIDASIELFGRLFACVSIRHRTQMLEHFSECIRLTKSIRQDAVQINVFAALLSALRYLTETKSTFGDDPALRKAASSLIFSRLCGDTFGQKSTLMINGLQRSIVYDATLTSPSVLLRCVAGECLGRLAQVVGESGFLAELAQQIFERLRAIRNPIARAGHCLAIGCLHRYVGGLASGQHLSSSVGILLAIAQDSSVPEVQVWALHALALVADSGGPIFREYVEPSLNLVLQLLLKSPSAMHEIQRSLGRLFAALITTLGPELRGTSACISSVRHSCLLCCTIMRDSSDPLLQAEGIACLQQLHVFAPMHVKLAGLVPELQTSVISSHLVLRRAALSCLRQLSQKEALDLYGCMTQVDSPEKALSPVHSSSLFSTVSNKSAVSNSSLSKSMIVPTTKLETQLFSLLDVEMDYQLRRDIEDTLIGMLHATGTSQLFHWFELLKEVLQVSTTLKTDLADSSSVSFTNPGQNPPNINESSSIGDKAFSVVNNSVDISERSSRGGDESSGIESDDVECEDADINFKPKQSNQENNQLFSVKIMARCPTRIFAITCLRILISNCAKLCNTTSVHGSFQPVETSSAKVDDAVDNVIRNSDPLAHFDLAKARVLRSQLGKSDWLILYLSDLIRIAFMSATSDSERLRITGLKLMQDVIQRFSLVPDPDYPDHVILEQYQAQVSAALRPAFMQSSSFNSFENTSVAQSSTANTSFSSSSAQPNPELLSMACQVCSTWLTSGVGRDPEDLRRVQDLLKQALDKLKLDRVTQDCISNASMQAQHVESSDCISENSTIIEKLSVLAAWAEVYIAAAGQAKKRGSKCPQKQHLDTSHQSLHSLDEEHPMDDESYDIISGDSENEDDLDYSMITKGISVENIPSSIGKTGRHFHWNNGFKTLNNKFIYHLLSRWIQPLLPSLSRAWLDALKCYAYMCLPDNLTPNHQQLTDIKSSSTLFNRISNSNINLNHIRGYYAHYWPCMIYASALWLTSNDYNVTEETDMKSSKGEMTESARHFFLILGMCVEAMCNPTSKQPLSIIHTCLRCILCLLSRSKFRAYLMQTSIELSIELSQVLHRLLLTRDCVETHLLCLANVIHILIASNERLVKERDDWLTKESTQNPSSMFISPETQNTNHNNCMTSSIMLQTTGLIDAQLYELGDGGYLARFFDRSNYTNTDYDEFGKSFYPDCQTNTNNQYGGRIYAGLHPERSIVFTCLEIVVCIVTRYQPQIIKQFRLSNTALDDVNCKSHIIPETPCSSDFNAPLVLATALKCLLPLVDLCAPQTLLSTLRLAKQNQNIQSNDCLNNNTTNTQSETYQPVSSSQTITRQKECLLPIILDLTNEITKSILLKQIQPSNGKNNFATYESQTNNDNLSIFKSYDLVCQSSNLFTSCLIGDDETEISSTTTNLSVGVNQPGIMKHHQQQKLQHHCYIGYLIGWNEHSLQLAEAYITLLSKLASHHYPALAASPSYYQDISVNNKYPMISSQATETQPDSSSITTIKDKISGITNTISDVSSQSLALNITRDNSESNTAFTEWYHLISLNLLSVLRHGHFIETEVKDNSSLPKCCLAAMYLVSRICNSCPAQIFTPELVNELSNLLCRAWTVSQISDSQQSNRKMNENYNSLENMSLMNISKLFESKTLQNRIICLKSFELLCSHHEPSIQSSFIKTLTPQVFHWLYELTTIIEMYPPKQQQQQKLFDDKFNNQVNLNELVMCLNGSFDLLTSLISIVESSSRQSLLLIYLPLLCNLLTNEPSILQYRSHSKKDFSFTSTITTRTTTSSTLNLSDLIYFIHMITLKHIIAIAPCFPNEFRSTFQLLSDYKLRLENAIKLSSPLINGNNNSHDYSQSKYQLPGMPFNCTNQTVLKQSQSNIPSIRLKTDFSNFT